MKLLNYNQVLQDFQYKPNWAYGAYEREKGEWWIRVIMLVEDSRQPFRPWEPRSTRPREINFFDDYDRHHLMADRLYSPVREMIEVVGNYPIPYFGVGDELPFISWMTYTIKSMEQHESDEWLRYKGELLNDPHKEVGT
jgi:hypothetical protein